ncbi:MAG: low temperature requirement protein A [Salana multivorans]|uniref:low temperature requirement protein A n=1 Tax=Salana multivorans TaxID=120377 RepID=UPI00095C676F|nr:low temperature requirement protein A [Salana multivorans]MBN8882949.1 low temperature requirement protein A [Salana multivorans]OJX95318.1 MAG: low temperature requirement protein A [Micrococcales bacterium 73-15]
MTTVSSFRLLPMTPRDPREPGRTASTLELFFDLVFVIAVSIAASHLHHALTDGHVLHAVGSYAIVFFAIWWAWMNFTWFATSFDTDDWLYRVLTIVQMGGVLVLAAGIGRAFDDGDYSVMIVAYVVMRLALVAQWLRASRRAGPARRATLVYAGGVAIVQVLWLASLLLPSGSFPAVLVVLVAAELAVPVLAERTGTTPWHPHHITERYGCFALILLGESLLASASAIIGAVDDAEALGPLIALGVLTLVATAALWWIYFWPPHHRAIGSLRSSLTYGYGHFFVFAAAGAFSAGIEVELDVLTGHGELHQPWASFAYTVPLTVFLLGIWLIAIRRYADRVVNTVLPVAALLVLVDPLVPVPFALTSAILAGTVAVLVWRTPRSAGDGS